MSSPPAAMAHASERPDDASWRDEGSHEQRRPRIFYGFVGREKFPMFPDDTPEGKQRHARRHSQPLGPTPSPDEIPDRPKPATVTNGAEELARGADEFVSGLAERRRVL
jgi:hypothetical protein